MAAAQNWVVFVSVELLIVSSAFPKQSLAIDQLQLKRLTNESARVINGRIFVFADNCSTTTTSWTETAPPDVRAATTIEMDHFSDKHRGSN